MKAHYYISKRERTALLLFTFAIVIFILSGFITEGNVRYNSSVAEIWRNIEYQNSVYPCPSFSSNYVNYTIPDFHLLIVFIFASLLKTKRFLLPFLLTIIYAASLIYSIPARFDARRLGGEEFSPYVNVFNKLYFEANYFDYTATFFILILLFWQLSILFRIFNKIRQNKIGFQ